MTLTQQGLWWIDRVRTFTNSDRLNGRQAFTFVWHIFVIVIVIIIVIVSSRFIERPQKRSRGNQLIHRRLTKTKLIGSGQDPESQAGRQDGYMVDGVWSWDGEGGMGMNRIAAIILLGMNRIQRSSTGRPTAHCRGSLPIQTTALQSSSWSTGDVWMHRCTPSWKRLWYTPLIMCIRYQAHIQMQS